jgi:hypothetical protein
MRAKYWAVLVLVIVVRKCRPQTRAFSTTLTRSSRNGDCHESDTGNVVRANDTGAIPSYARAMQIAHGRTYLKKHIAVVGRAAESFRRASAPKVWD